MLHVVLILLLSNFVIPYQTKYDNYRLVTFTANRDTAKWLHYWEEHGTRLDPITHEPRTLIDVFSEPSRAKREAVVLVAPEFYNSFVHMLRTRGVYDVVVLREDVQRELDLLAQMGAKRRVRRTMERSSNYNLDEYHNYDEMVTYMKLLAEEYPNHVRLIEVGRSYENRTIYGINFVGHSSRHSSVKPAIFLDAGVHAREWIAPAAALYVIDVLARAYGRNGTITHVVDKFDWYIVPQINPDGYEYSRTTDRLWRKTRSRNITVSKWCVGADANRNWGYRWGQAGANRSPCSNIYAGSHPFSETEIREVDNYVHNNIPHLMIYVSLHSYGQILLSPWGYTSAKPENYLDQKSAAELAIMAIRNATGADYKHGTISELMYPASGTSIDYMQDRGVPYIYGIELRPTDSVNSFAFSLPPSHIRGTGQEMLAALLALAEYATIAKRL